MGRSGTGRFRYRVRIERRIYLFLVRYFSPPALNRKRSALFDLLKKLARFSYRETPNYILPSSGSPNDGCAKIS
jgi:hypothetical protein